MDFTNFYHMKCAYRRTALHAEEVSNELVLPAIDILKGTKPNLRPVFKRFSGSRLYDMVGTTSAMLVLVSPKFVATLTNGEFTGWELQPVDLYGRNSEPVDGYGILQVTGRCGPLVNALSENVLLPPPVSGGKPMKALKGMYFGEDSWDGSDIFCPEDTGHCFITAVVKDTLTKARIKNVAFTSLPDVIRHGMPLTDD